MLTNFYQTFMIYISFARIIAAVKIQQKNHISLRIQKHGAEICKIRVILHFAFYFTHFKSRRYFKIQPDPLILEMYSFRVFECPLSWSKLKRQYPWNQKPASIEFYITGDIKIFLRFLAKCHIFENTFVLKLVDAIQFLFKKACH